MFSRLLLVLSLVTLTACSSESAEEPAACTELGCDCALPTDCDPGLVCGVGQICIPAPADAGNDAEADVEPDVSAPDTDTAPEVDVAVPDVTEEVVEDQCIIYCEARVACGLEPIPGIEGDCPAACEQFALILVQGTADALDVVACDASFRAFIECVTSLTECADLERADADPGAFCSAEAAQRDADCVSEEVPPDEGSGTEGSGAEGSGTEGSGTEGSGA
jgi:hypothetical protein